MLARNQIYLGDCLELMKQIPDGSVDCIITDPPYLTTALRFDKIKLDFDAIFLEFKRILKPMGWFFLFGTCEMYAEAAKYFRRKFEYVWVKPHVVFKTHAAVRPFYSHELIFAFVHKEIEKVSKLCFNKKALRIKGDSYSIRHYRNSNYTKAQYGYESRPHTSYNDGYREGRTTLFFPKVDLGKHSTVKPIPLLETIVKGYTNEKDLILDPFCGTGSTCVACKRNDRDFIGIEIDKEYHHYALQRIGETYFDYEDEDGDNETTQQKNLFNA